MLSSAHVDCFLLCGQQIKAQGRENGCGSAPHIDFVDCCGCCRCHEQKEQGRSRFLGYANLLEELRARRGFALHPFMASP